MVIKIRKLSDVQIDIYLIKFKEMVEKTRYKNILERFSSFIASTTPID